MLCLHVYWRRREKTGHNDMRECDYIIQCRDPCLRHLSPETKTSSQRPVGLSWQSLHSLPLIPKILLMRKMKDSHSGLESMLLWKSCLPITTLITRSSLGVNEMLAYGYSEVDFSTLSRYAKDRKVKTLLMKALWRNVIRYRVYWRMRILPIRAIRVWGHYVTETNVLAVVCVMGNPAPNSNQEHIIHLLECSWNNNITLGLISVLPVFLMQMPNKCQPK